MNAKKAVEKADNFYKTNDQYTEIVKKIKKASSKGNYSCTIYKILEPDVLEKLEVKGFIVIERNDYPCFGVEVKTRTIIAWHNK